MSKKKPTKKDFQKDFKKVSQKFIEDFPNTPVAKMTRDFYRKNSEYGGAFQTIFGKFDNLKNEMLTEEDLERGRDFDLEKKIVTLEAENSKLKKNNKELLKGAVEEDDLLQLFDENLRKIEKFPVHKNKIKTKGKKSFILNLSDFHLGEVVKPEDVNYVNSFNKDICIERLNNVFYQVIELSKTIGADKIYILLNGDTIAGGIHNELSRNSDLSEVESILFLQKYLVEKFTELSKYFNIVDVECIVGNHARILQGRPYFKEKTVMSYEYLLGMMIKKHFDLLTEVNKNNKVFVNVPKSSFIIKEVNNQKFLVTHGDILAGGSGGFSGLPYYGLCMSAAKMYGVLHQIGVNENIQFSNIIIGHFHTTSKIPIFTGGNIYVNGCIVGSNEFSLYKMKSVAKKEQTLLVLDDEKIDGEITIKFD